MEIVPDTLRMIKLPGVVRREKRLRQEYPTKSKPDGWQTTDPLSHIPDNFRYIVHTTSKAAIANAAWETYAKRLGPKREMHGESWEVLIADFLARNSTSCTIIDEIHRTTYKWDVVSHGFILNVPEENIVALDPTDLGTHNHVQDKQERAQRHNTGIDLKNRTPSAQAFLETCSNDFRNEVLIDGIGSEGRQIRIAGVFLITDSILDVPLDELHSQLRWNPGLALERILSFNQSESVQLARSLKDEYQEMQKVAQLLEVPIIHIQAPLGNLISL